MEVHQIRAINQHQSLIHRTVRDVAFAPDGTLWFATLNGLVHYDGHRFNNFQYAPQNPKGLSSNNIYTLAFDRHKRLWLASADSLGFIQPQTGIYTAIESPPQQCDSGIRFIVADSQGNIWGVNRTHRLFKYDIDRQQAHCFEITSPDDPLSAQLTMTTLKFDSGSNSVWLATSRGLVKFDITTEKIEFVDHIHPKLALPTIGVGFDDTGRVWAGTTDRGVYWFNPSTKAAYHYSPERYPLLKGKSILDVQAQGDEIIWLSSRKSGLLKIAQNQVGKLEAYDPLNHTSLPPTVFRAELDQNDNLWLATIFGVFIKPASNQGLSAINREKLAVNDEKLLLDGLFFSPSLGLMLGSNSGLFRWQNDTLERLDNPQQPIKNVSGFYQVDHSQLYMCHLEGLVHYQLENKKFTVIDNSEDTKWCADFALQNPDTLWIASQHRGLTQLNLKTGKMNRLPEQLKSQLSQFSQTLMALFFDNQHRLWIGSADKGLAMLDTQSLKLTVFEDEQNKPIGSMITDIAQDNRGFVWISSFSGLSRLDLQTGQFRHFHVKNGLSSDMLNHIETDADGDLWISSQDGISRVNPTTLNISRYYQSDSLFEDEFFIHYMSKGPDGKIYIAGIETIMIIDPVTFKRRQATHHNLITDVRQDNQSLDWRVTQPLQFEKSPSSLTIHFATTDYFSAHASQFRYRMSGLDTAWQTIQTNAPVNYSNLPHGDYHFEVQGKTKAGEWLEPAATLYLNIAPPWYFSYWAFALYFVLFSGLVVLLVLVATHRQKRKAIELQQLVNRQTDSLNLQNQKISKLLSRQQRLFVQLSHEIRTPLTLMFAPWQKLKHQHRDEYKQLCETADYNKNRLLLLLDQLLDIAQNDHSQYSESKPLSVRDAIGWVYHAIEPLTVKKSQQVSLNLDNPGYIGCNKDALEKMLLNLLVNAHKYTPKNSRIEINAFSKNGQFTQIEINDNGPGIARDKQQAVFECFERIDSQDAQPGTGVGLALVKQLVQSNNGTIDLYSEPGKGCRFILVFPKVNPAQLPVYKQPDALITQPADMLNPPAVEVSEHTFNDDKRPLVLVVEDNLQMQQFIKQILTDDFQVMLQPDGQQGMQYAVEHVPDIIISDIMMPVMDGYQMLEAIKSHPATNHIPVLMLTAKSGQQSLMTALHLRADDYINKPFDAEVLKLKLDNLLHLRQMWHQHYRQSLEQPSHQPGSDKAIVVKLNPQNQAFVDKLKQLCVEHGHNSQFGIDELEQMISMSKRQLQRKVKALLDTTPLALLKDTRLELARQAIERGEQITQAGYAYGFNSYDHFARAFKEKYQLSPRHYLEQKQMIGD